MSVEFGKVVSLMLLERFGEVVEKIGTLMYKTNPNSLASLRKQLKFPLSKIKETLCVLIKHGLVSYKPSKNELNAVYTIHADRVLLMLRYPKYIHLIKKKIGSAAETMVEHCLIKGYDTATNLILQTCQKLNKNGGHVTLTEVRDILQSLIVAKYLKRCPQPTKDEKPVPEFAINLNDEHILPNLDLKQLHLMLNGDNTIKTGDENVYFHVNFDRFHQDLRDDAIVDAIANKFDKNAGELLRVFLQQMYIRTEPWADVSNPVPIVEVRDLIRKQNNFPLLVAFFDQYLNILEQDKSGLLIKAGEASGGSYQINMKEIYTKLAWETIEQAVLEKFDSKACRIFRLIKTKKYIEPEHIQQLAMIPGKEAKKLSYELLEQNFVQIQELKKSTQGNGPNKCFTLFHIQLEQVIRMILELCYKTLFNLMTRKNHDKYENKRIIDKKERIDTISMGMRLQGATEEQLVDIEEMLTPPEREILDKINKTMKKLNTVEMELDSTIFLIQMYLAYE